MNFIKKNSIEFISLVVFLVLLIGGGLFFLSMWNQGTGTKYGSRLEGINKIKISESDLNKIEKKINETFKSDNKKYLQILKVVLLIL